MSDSSATRNVVIALSIILGLTCMVAAGAYMAWTYVDAGGSMSTQPDREWQSPPEGATHVLFIGNNHTKFHDLPGQVQRIGKSNGVEIWVDQVYEGGGSLHDHLRSGRAMDKLRAGEWDYVVLQEQSLRPATYTSDFLDSVDKFAEAAEEQGAEIIIFATWPRAAWNDFYEDTAVDFTRAAFRERLEEAFHEAGDGAGRRVAPVSAAWTRFEAKYPERDLYQDNGNHATHAGGHLAACVLYGAITGRPSSKTSFFPEVVEKSVAWDARGVADASHEKWTKRWEESSSSESKAAESDASDDDPRPIGPLDDKEPDAAAAE